MAYVAVYENATPNANLVVNVTGVAAGDILVACMVSDTQPESGGLTLPSGFVIIGTTQVCTGDAQSMFKSYKVADGTETNITFSTVSTNTIMGHVLRFSGRSGSTPLDVAAVQDQTSSNTTTTPTAAITPVTDGCDIVVFNGADTTGSDTTYSWAITAGTDPASITARSDIRSGFFNLGAATAGQTVAGAFTITVTRSISSGNAICLIALRPDVVPGPKKISELPARGTPALTDLLILVDAPGGSPLSRKTTVAQLLAGFLKTPVITRITATGAGTYTPTTGMVKVWVRAQGGGGGGRSATATDEVGGGGGGGGYCEKLFDAATIGASKAYVVGAFGAANAAGSDTTFNTTTLVASGGATGSVTGTSTTVGVQAAGGAGGAATGGDINIPGEPAGRGTIYSGADGRGGYGGDSYLGVGGAGSGTNAVGGAATGKGGGGGGAHAPAATDRAGGAGSNGTIEFWEFID